MAIGSKYEIPNDAKGLPILRAMGHPLLFDSRGTSFNLGVANAWVTLFNLSNYQDRVFTGISVYNPNNANQIYLAFEPAAGSESKIMMVEPGSTISLDEITFGPGFNDPITGKRCVFVRAMCPANVGTAAAATITYTTNPSNLDQVSINGTNNYQFVSALDGRAGAGATYFNNGSIVQVLIGGSANASWTNLKNAIIANDLTLTASINTGAGVVTVSSLFTGTGPNADVFADGTDPTGATFTGSGTLGGSGATAGTAGIIVDAQIW